MDRGEGNGELIAITDVVQKIHHAGYEREIISRNAKRYNIAGEELDDDELDIAEEESIDPYSDVKLEGELMRTALTQILITAEILRPLTHPADLGNHIALTAAYKDPALSEMVLGTESKIREERRNLWQAKNLYRFFTGDESWIPCERVEIESDWDLFGPHPGFSPSKKRKLSGDMEIDVDDEEVEVADIMDEAQLARVDDVLNVTLQELQSNAKAENQDQEMQDDDIQVNGVDHNNQKDEIHPRETGIEETTNKTQENHTDDEGSTVSTPPPPPRRITRALAAEAETNSQQQNPSPPPTSPSPLSSPPLSPTAFDPDPLFLLPPHLAAIHAPHPSHYPLSVSLTHSGLPPDEMLETRKVLALFIQKSEETIRGLEHMLGKLIKAKRRRDRLFEWCIAEGHVGEMSDGEDWIDEERWGLQKGELKKGRDEDGAVAGVIEQPNTGETEDNNNAAVVMGGRKGKRRRGAGAKE